MHATFWLTPNQDNKLAIGSQECSCIVVCVSIVCGCMCVCVAKGKIQKAQALDLMRKEFLTSNLMAIGQGYRKGCSVSKLLCQPELTCGSGGIRWWRTDTGEPLQAFAGQGRRP